MQGLPDRQGQEGSNFGVQLRAKGFTMAEPFFVAAVCSCGLQPSSTSGDDDDVVVLDSLEEELDD